MAARKVIRIDEAKCDGCGECVTSCAEGAIAILDGKARLVSEIYCDGLGACLGHCPQGAIAIEEREAEEFSEDQVRSHLARLGRQASGQAPLPLLEAPAHQCPGSAMRSFARPSAAAAPPAPAGAPAASELTSWPIQLSLVPPMAPFLRGADILLVADCVPFACPDFHQRFLRGKPVLIGCPKLDQTDVYAKKLAEILRTARPKSLTVVHMQVPCCSGLTRLAQYAVQASASDLPITDVVIGIQGEVLQSAELAAAR
jgi:Pyruvate/2-oxoacid:ferredoxin oxidoreductase delta subunit